MHYKLFILAILLTAITQLDAQNESRPREVGLQFSSFDFDGGSSFSAFYKKQKSENVYRRIRFFAGNIGAQFVEERFSLGLSAGIAIGREKRKSLDEKLQFYQGPEFSVSLGFAANSEDQTSIVFSPRFGWVVGLQHSFNDRWAVNLETIPGIGVNLQYQDDDSSSLAINAGFSNTVSLGLVRKF